MKRRFFFLVWAFLCLFATGCSPSSELAETGVVKGIAIDSAEDGFLLTLCLLNPRGEQGYAIVTAEGKSLSQAQMVLAEKTGKSVFLMQSDIVILSKALLQAGKWNEISNYFLRNQTFASQERLAVSQGSAGDCFHLETVFYESPATSLLMTLNHGEEEGAILNANFQTMQLQERECGVGFLPLLEKKEGAVLATGMTVLRQGQWLGQFSKEESMGMKWIRGKMQRQMLFPKLGEEQISCRILNQQTVVSEREIRMLFDFVVEEQSGSANFQTKAQAKALQHALESMVENQALQARRKAQTMGLSLSQLAGKPLKGQALCFQAEANLKFEQG